MEVIVPEVKPDPAILESSAGRNLAVNNRQLQQQRGGGILPPALSSASPAVLSSSGAATAILNNKIATINSVSSAAVSVRNNNHLQNSIITHPSSIPSTAQFISSSAPVRITTISGQQLETMAKSSGLSVVHVTVPQQSVIQSPSSVIQSAAGQLQLQKGNVILVKQNPGSVIQSAGGAIQTVQVVGSPQSDESLSNDGIDHPNSGRNSDKKRREILSRRPSYRKIFSELSGAEISGDRGDSASTSESSQDADGSCNSGILIGNTQYPPGVVKVIPANALGLGEVPSAAASNVPAAALQTITMTNAGTGGTIVQYAQSQDGQQFFVPVGSDLQAYTIRPVSVSSSTSSTCTSPSSSVVVAGSLSGGQHHHGPDEANKKREIRLLKNREAARECRRKKKEYIKCLENRVAVLENQNKALIDELKSLKELYCQQKTE